MSGDEVRALRDWLREIDDNAGGVLRLQLQVVNKHTGEAVADGAQLPVETLLPELDAALRALVFQQHAVGLLREVIER